MKTEHTSTLVAAALAACTMLAGCGGSDDGPVAATPLACDDSLKAAFKPDANTSVLLVKSYKKGDQLPNAPFDGVQTVGNDLCLVKLLVGPGNPGPADAPSTSAGIGIEVWLPTKEAWNGRLHAVGNGGWAGTNEAAVTKVSTVALGPDFRSASTIAALEGAVTANSDTGHQGANNDGSFAMNPDGTINKTLWVDFASRAIHEQVVKAKALAAAYYGSAPKYTYWDGGSTGGRQGLKQAQVYPQDFDGIIAGYPAINWTKFVTAGLYPQIVMQRDLGGVHLSPAQLTAVSKAAVSACDLVGGVHLGFPLDPSSCKYDPSTDATMLCSSSGGTNTSSACLTGVQAAAVNKMWYGMTSDGSVPDPTIDNGWSRSLAGAQRWWGLPRGTMMLALAGPTPFTINSDMTALELQDPTIASTNFQNATGNGADKWNGLSYAQLSNAFDRGVALQESFGNINTDSPDLSAFKARGGKLISYHGLNDPLIFPQGSINYFDRVAAAMGGAVAIQDFSRFYLVPGMGHGPNNGTANEAANLPLPAPGQMYQLMTDWVEKGIAPNNVVISTASTAPAEVSLPLCPYPQRLSYKGSGNPSVAASYACQ